MSVPPVSQQGPVETWTEKFSRKFDENPWVPIGCVATVGALVMSVVKKRHGKSQEMNYWFRARVGLQGATLVALLLGSTWGRDWMKANFGIGKIETPSIAEIQAQKKAQEKLEFEERLRGAQETAAQEEAVGLTGKMTVKGPVVNTKRHDEKDTKAEERVVKSEEKTSTSEAVKKSASWRLWSRASSDSDGKDGSDSTKTS